MTDGIAYNGRTLVIGSTGSGKSELLNVQFSSFRCQRLLYDSKGEFRVPGVDVVRDPELIDWRKPLIHFEPGEQAVSDAQTVFRAALRQPHPLVIAVHEMGDLCDYNANAAPDSVKRYMVQGRAKGKGLIGGTQRPVGIPKTGLTEAGDFFVFAPRLSFKDLAAVAQELNVSQDQLGGWIDTMHQRLGDHSFLRYTRASRALVQCPPLPAKTRKRSIVKRSLDH